MSEGTPDNHGLSYSLIMAIREEIKIHDSQIREQVKSAEERFKVHHENIHMELESVRDALEKIQCDQEAIKKDQTVIKSTLSDWCSGAKWVNRIAIWLSTLIATAALSWDWLVNHFK